MIRAKQPKRIKEKKRKHKNIKKYITYAAAVILCIALFYFIYSVYFSVTL